MMQMELGDRMNSGTDVSIYLNDCPQLDYLDTNYNQKTSHDVNASSQLGAMDGQQSCVLSQQQSTMHADPVPDIHGARGSQASHQMLGNSNTKDTSNNLVDHTANNREMTVECGSMSLIGQVQAINGPKSNLIPTEQSFMTTSSIPPVPPVMNTQSPIHMNTGCGPHDQILRLNDPKNNIVSQQHFAVAPNSSVMNTQSPIHMNIGCGPHDQILRSNHPKNNIVSQQHFAVTTSSSVMNTQSPIHMNIGCGPHDQILRLNDPKNNIVSQQHFAVAPKSSVGASQHQNLENNRGIRDTADLLASLSNKTKEAGSEPQCDRQEDVNVQLRLNDNQNPSGGMIVLMVPQFEVKVPTSLPPDSWKVEIIKQLEATLDIRNIKLSIPPVTIIDNKRAMQTVFPDFQERDMQKRKKVDGPTEDDFSYDFKTNIVEGPEDSKEVLRPGMKNSTNALAGEIPLVRNQAAPSVIQKSTGTALFPQMEARNFGSMHQTSEFSQHCQRRFSPAETELLVQAVYQYGAGKWQEIKQQAFRSSGRTCNELKDKWRSLVKTANKPPATRRGLVVSEELLFKVLCIVTRDAKQGKPGLSQDQAFSDY